MAGRGVCGVAWRTSSAGWLGERRREWSANNVHARDAAIVFASSTMRQMTRRVAALLHFTIGDAVLVLRGIGVFVFSLCF